MYFKYLLIHLLERVRERQREKDREVIFHPLINSPNGHIHNVNWTKSKAGFLSILQILFVFIGG